MSVDFGSIDPAAFILALVALFIGLESIVNPLCSYVRIPRHAYTTFYRSSMITAYAPERPSEYDWILSIAISRTAFMGLWSWTNYHAYLLLDTPIGLGQWILYPISQTGSGTLTALVIAAVTPIWFIKLLYIKFMWLDVDFRTSKRNLSIAALVGLSEVTPIAFHLQILGNVIKTLGRYDSLYGKAAQTVLSRLALSMAFPLGAGTLAFSQVGSSGVWTGVFYDLVKHGYLPSIPGYKDVMAGDVRLSLKDNTFEVDIPSLRSYVGCSYGSKHGDIGQMVRILISHGICDPIDGTISTWGLSREQLYQVRFTYVILQRDKSLERRLKNAQHWITRKIRLTKRLRSTSASSPWCDCHYFCFCSLRGIMFTPPLKLYHDVRGIIITNDVKRALRNSIIQDSGAIALTSDNKNAIELLKIALRVIVDGNAGRNSAAHTVLQLE
jgi:hypothetical protein